MTLSLQFTKNAIGHVLKALTTTKKERYQYCCHIITNYKEDIVEKTFGLTFLANCTNEQEKSFSRHNTLATLLFVINAKSFDNLFFENNTLRQEKRKRNFMTSAT